MAVAQSLLFPTMLWWAKSNYCNLVHNSNRLGRSLDFDPVKRRFIGDDEANAMLTREYRKPFVVPNEV